MSRTHLPFLLLLVTYLLIASAYAVRTPAWQAPDEPAHYNYIRQLADGHFPLMEMGDYDEVYRQQVVSSRFDPQYPIDSFEYEDYQPPLYYLLQTPIFRLTNGSLTALRLVSVLLGAITVTLAYKIGRIIFPSRPHLPLTAAALIALLPQHLSILGSVNNDALAGVLVAGMLWLVVTQGESAANGKQRSAPSHLSASILLSLSLLLGLAFLTKVTAYLMAGALGFWLLWLFWGDWRGLWRAGLKLFVPALLIGMIWWGRNIITYPGPDFLGITMHDRVVVGQLETGDWVESIGVEEAVRLFGRNSFRSFWGQFGWMCCPMPNWTYPPLALLTIAGISGFFIRTISYFRVKKHAKNSYLVALGSLFALNLLLFLTYNLSFVQHQARYLFVSLIPIGLLLTVGWSLWVDGVTKRLQWSPYLLPIGLIGGLVGLNLLVIRSTLPCMSIIGC